jgi:hypothetical protein
VLIYAALGVHIFNKKAHYTVIYTWVLFMLTVLFETQYFIIGAIITNSS